MFCNENNLPKKAILLVDNCSAHGSSIEPLQSDDKQIICYFLPPNVTAILQPMDQGPIKITKLKYRNLLLCKIISELETFDGTIVDLLKKHTIKDTIVFLKKAWDEISSSVLVTSWNNVLRYDDDEFEPEDSLPLTELMAYSSLIQETQARLKQLNANARFNDADIEQWNSDIVNESEVDQAEIPGEQDVGDVDDDDDDEESDCVAAAEPKVTHSAALDCVNQLLKWCNENQSTKYVTGLLDLRTEVVDAAKQMPKKQTHMRDYFVNTSNT